MVCSSATIGTAWATSFSAPATVRFRMARSVSDNLSSPKLLITQPTVVALTNNVNSTNAQTKAATKLRTSSGKESFSKTANAKARDTAPLRPPHHITVRNPIFTGAATPALIKTGNTACVRSPRAAKAAAMRTTSVIHISPLKTERICGTTNPTNTKIKEFAQKPIFSHVSSRRCQPPAEMLVLPCEPITNAAATTAITPDTCK